MVQPDSRRFRRFFVDDGFRGYDLIVQFYIQKAAAYCAQNTIADRMVKSDGYGFIR